MACEAEVHKMHMCALKAEGNEELVSSLAKNPTYICENCGAKVNDPQYVCSPKAIS